MDLTVLDTYDPIPGYERVGGKAWLRWSADEGRMCTDRLELADGRVVHKPEQAEIALHDRPWRRAQDIFLASLSTYMTTRFHLVGCHLKGTGEPAAAAWHTLPPAHPLRVFLHPFVHETLSTNNYKVPQLVNTEASMLPAMFCFSATTLQRIVDDLSAVFDIATYDPHADARARGMDGFDGPYPYLRDATALFDLFVEYAGNALDTMYASDAELQSDEAVGAWLDLWSTMSPSIRAAASPLTKPSLARLLATVIFLATTVHENVGKVTWNYSVLHEYIPSRVPLDAARDTIQVQQEYMHLTLATFLPQARLMQDDLVDIAPDEASKQVARDFLQALARRQEAMEAEDGPLYPRPHRLYPLLLQRAVNA